MRGHGRGPVRWDRRAGRGRGASGVVRTVDDLPDVEGIVVAVPAVAHAEVVDSVLRRGVPIFVEKPLTVDPAWAQNLAATTVEQVFVMDKWRYHPGVELLRDIARSGEFGAVVGLETVRTGWGDPHANVDGIWHLAPHDLSIVLEILGFIPEPRSARADRTNGAAAGIVGSSVTTRGSALRSAPGRSVGSGRSPSAARTGSSP